MATQDNLAQTEIAKRTMRQAKLVAIPLVALCELAWVMRRGYNYSHTNTAIALRLLTEADNVACDRAAVRAGLAILDAGGDFADGVIAHEGKWLGGETFVSFDKEAVTLLSKAGHATKLL